MENINCRFDLPVIVIHNQDPSWSPLETLDDQQETRLFLDALKELGHPVDDICIQNDDLESQLERFRPEEHLIFNWCEEIPGYPHSEYRAAQILDQMGFTYTGADTQALLLSQNKIRIKELLKAAGIPTPAWKVYTQPDIQTWDHFPAIVKPAFEHCGVGISRESVVQSMEALTERILYVLDVLKEPAIVEDFIDGREFHVGVIGNGLNRMLPPAEIDYTSFEDIHDRLCTYEANFDKSSRAYQLTIPRLPADLTLDELTRLERTVIAAYQVTECRDYARMDVRFQAGVFYVLDVNHNADISSDNSLVRAAALVGLSYGQLGSLLINLAAARHPVFRWFSPEDASR